LEIEELRQKLQVRPVCFMLLCICDVCYCSMLLLLLLEVFFLKFQGSHSEVLEQLILKQRNDMHKVCKVLSRT
jgi:hypothetical protein